MRDTRGRYPKRVTAPKIHHYHGYKIKGRGAFRSYVSVVCPSAGLLLTCRTIRQAKDFIARRERLL